MNFAKYVGYTKSLFNLLKVAPDAPVKNSDELLRENYRFWQNRILSTITIGYVAFYMVRKSLAVAQPVIEEEFGIPKSQLGLILTVFGITYGISKFINGFAGDKTNPRYFMSLGLLCSAVINVFFGLSSGVVAFGIFWILNGWFQGMGWAPCSRSLVQWFPAENRGFNFSICNCAVSIGAALIMFLNGWLVVKYGWRSCFYVPAGIAGVVAVFVLIFLRDRPQSLGLPSVEQYAGMGSPDADLCKEDATPYWQMVMQYIFNNPMMWILCLGNFFVYVIRYSFFDWGTTFLKEHKGLDLSDAAWVVGGYEVAGIAGMLLGGWAMDRLFHGYGGRTCTIYMGLCTLCVLAFWKLPIEGPWLNGAALCVIGFLVYGPQCMVAVIAANMVPKNAGAAAIGFTGLFGYLSTSLSGVGLGIIVHHYKWEGGFLMLVISSAIGTLMFLLLWNNRPLCTK